MPALEMEKQITNLYSLIKLSKNSKATRVYVIMLVKRMEQIKKLTAPTVSA